MDLNESVGNLVTSVESLRVDIGDLHDSVETAQETIETNKKRLTTNRWTARIGIAVGIIGLVIAGIAVKQTRDANEQRASRTTVACQQSVVANQRNADLAKRDFDGLITSFINASQAQGNPGPSEATLKSYLEAQHKRIQDEYDVPWEDGGTKRTCTPAGIAAFYKENQ